MSSSESSSDSGQSSISKPPHAKNSLHDDDDNTSGSDSESADSSTDGDSKAEDTQVLSHAEKRRQKKELKNKARDEKAAENKVKNTAEIAPSKAPKRQNSVWVGNLTFKTTPQSLRQFFDGVGEITRIHMPMKLTSGGPSGGAVKENRGFAYVDFATPEAKVVAITLSENHLDGRRLLIKDGDDFDGRPSTSKADPAEGTPGKPSGTTKTAQKILSAQKQPPGPTLFLGNLGFAATDESIREMFDRTRTQSKGGAEPEDEEQKPGLSASIRKIRMGTFEDTGKCKGWAFADFTNTEAATAALTSRKAFYLDGRQLVVEFASPDAVRRGGYRSDARDKKPIRSDSAQDNERPKRKAFGEEGDESKAHDAEDKPWKRRHTDDERSERRRTTTKDGRPKFRPKPGAALALAKRQEVAIVPSQGKKTVFE
ncbi:unnamed protein product [Somion occarium]|uniref:RRM domain-containing protein n=1 Tax=Somion occarium TaxID=3059160 RepID=A0ABP1CZB8_9APHY